MAEAVGLAIGVVGLTALFSTCVECFEYVDIARNYEKDREILAAKLRVEQVRLWIWGQVLGLHKSDSAGLLMVPLIRATVENNLGVIIGIFGSLKDQGGKYGLREIEDLSTGYQLLTSTEASTRGSKLQATFGTSATVGLKSASPSLRARWALHDKSKVTTLIEDLKALIDGLHDVTPGNVSRNRLLVRREIQAIEDCDALQLVQEATEDQYQDWSDTASVALERYTVAEPEFENVTNWMAMTNIQPTFAPQIETLIEQPPQPVNKARGWKTRLLTVRKAVTNRRKLVKDLPSLDAGSLVKPVFSPEDRRKTTLHLAFSRAVIDGRLNDIQKFIDQGADIHGRDSANLSLLHYAMKGRHFEVVERFANPEMVSACEEYGRSLVHYWLDLKSATTSDFGYEGKIGEFLPFLLHSGANLEARNQSGDTPLIVAARKDEEFLLRQFIEAGADVEAKNPLGRTALSYAVYHTIGKWIYRDSSMCSLLIRHGADINSSDNDDYRPIHHLVSKEGMHSGANLQTLLDANVDLNVCSKNGRTPLDVALDMGGFLGAVYDLTRNGLKLPVKYTLAPCPLVAALEARDYRYANYLAFLPDDAVEFSVDHNHEGDLSCTQSALWVAVQRGQHSCTKVLLEKEPSAAIQIFRKTDNCSVLHLAIEEDDQEMVEILLESPSVRESLLNYESDLCHTPLLLAIGPPLKLTIATLLLKQYSVSLEASEIHRMSPLSKALENKNWEIAGIILQKASESPSYDLLGILLEVLDPQVNLLKNVPRFYDLNWTWSNFDQMAIHKIAKAGKTELMKLYLDLPRADTELLLKDSDGFTALEIAECEGHAEMARALREKMPSESNDLVSKSTSASMFEN